MLRDDERDHLAEMAMEDDGPDQVDPDLLKAIRELTAAVKAIETPKIPAFDVKPVAQAIANLAGVAKEITALRADIKGLVGAVSAIQGADMSAVAEAIKGLQAQQAAMVRAINTPKEVIYDSQNNPIGLRPTRMN